MRLGPVYSPIRRLSNIRAPTWPCSRGRFETVVSLGRTTVAGASSAIPRYEDVCRFVAG